MSLSLEDFRSRMRTESEKTRKIVSVQVSGFNLEDALKQASLELTLPLRSLDYEVLERGRRGFLGFKRTPCRIIAYEAHKTKAKTQNMDSDSERIIGMDKSDSLQDNANQDGRIALRLASEGALVKVFPPRGTGVPATMEECIGKLQSRGVTDITMPLLSSVVEKADQIWVKCGDFEYVPEYSAIPSLNILENGMKAFLTIQKPGIGGTDLSAEDIKGFMYSHSIIHGIREDVIQELEDFPQYGLAFSVAEGTPPVHGSDAEIIYEFETKPKRINMEEQDGTVDFKAMKLVHNVVEGQVLARKIPAENGTDGQNIYGIHMPARDGRDLEFATGKNVAVVDAGSTVKSTVNGHVLLKSGVISVETILIIPDNVDMKTGNIDVLGSVDIRGNVEDGYSVNAQGNITVSGYVSKANLTAGGDILVSRGINGGEGDEFGHITAGKSLWSTFIQNAEVESGEFVIVSSGIVNSSIVAQRKVLCKGKRARIVGSHVKTSEEVNAVTLGSVSGVKTIIEVGFDPKVKEEVDRLTKERTQLEEQRLKIHLSLQRILRKVKVKKYRLTDEKKAIFADLKAQFNSLQSQIEAISEEIKQRQDYLDALVLKGKISASNKVQAGVILRIKDIEYAVRDAYTNPVTFLREKDYIRTIKYQAIEDDITRS